MSYYIINLDLSLEPTADGIASRFRLRLGQPECHRPPQYLTNSPTSRRASAAGPNDRSIHFQSVLFAARLAPAPITTLPPIRGGINLAVSGHGGGKDSAVDALVGLCQPRFGG